jgi:PAS domain S-box-containing protein
LQGVSWEYRLLTPQREIRWIRALGGPIYSNGDEITGYVGTTEDITELKYAHQAVQEREALNRAILNSLPADIAVLNADGTIRAINEEWQRCAETNDVPPACFLNTGANYLEVYKRAADSGLSDAHKALGGIQDVLTRKVQSYRMQYSYHLATEKRWLEMLVAPLVGVTSGGVVITHTDITDRKRAEDNTREALQQLQLITDNMPAAVTRCSRDLRYVWVSRGYAAWLGRAGPEDVSGRRFVDVAGQEFYDAIRPYVERVLSGERVEFETQVNYLGIGRRWVHAVYVPTRAQDGTVDGWIAVVADVTDRHEAAERLRKSEERFRATFFQAAVGMAQTSIDGHWLLLNDWFCQILGYSRDELREKTLIEIIHPDDREASLAACEKLLAGEISTWSSEKRYIRKDGMTVWARVFVSLVRDQHNEPEYFVFVMEDITERIRAERALQQSRQELRALTGRLINAQEEERKRISRELHDDLSQKLALLAFNAGGLLAEPALSSEKMNQKLRNLQGQVQQLAQDVRQISHRLHPSILDDLGLVAALSEMCDEFSAREGIAVAFESEAVPDVLPIDIASCLYRVSQEALHNVLEHAQASQVRLRLSASADGIHLCIRDNGVGFDSEAGLSQPGLGIVSMKERVGLVQGEFSINSSPGHGTELKVFVPLSRNAA